MGTRLYALRRIAGTASAHRLLTQEAAFPEPVGAVLAIHRTVLIDGTDVLLGHILLTGQLRTIYTYTAGGSAGAVKTLTLDFPFQEAVALSEAEPGMEVELQAAHVADAKTVITAQDAQGRILALRDTSLLQFALHLLREEEVAVADAPLQNAVGAASAASNPPPSPADEPGPPTSPQADLSPQPEAEIRISRFRFPHRTACTRSAQSGGSRRG